MQSQVPGCPCREIFTKSLNRLPGRDNWGKGARCPPVGWAREVAIVLREAMIDQGSTDSFFEKSTYLGGPLLVLVHIRQRLVVYSIIAVSLHAGISEFALLCAPVTSDLGKEKSRLALFFLDKHTRRPQRVCSPLLCRRFPPCHFTPFCAPSTRCTRCTPAFRIPGSSPPEIFE